MSSLSRFLTSRLKIGLCARLVALGRAYLGKPSRDSIHRRLEPHDTVPLPTYDHLLQFRMADDQGVLGGLGY
jgi:hypothetical protein